MGGGRGGGELSAGTEMHKPTWSFLRLERALAEHREAVEHYAARAAAVPPEAWAIPPAADAWSPAQITEHLVMVFDAAATELAGGAGIRPRLTPAWRLFWRWTALPWILSGRPFPRRVKTVREARPDVVDHPREVSIDRLGRAAATLEQAARSAGPEQRVTHPFFGRLSLPRAIQFSVSHVRHHTHQLSGDSGR